MNDISPETHVDNYRFYCQSSAQMDQCDDNSIPLNSDLPAILEFH